jgi:hypothetical protein
LIEIRLILKEPVSLVHFRGESQSLLFLDYVTQPSENIPPASPGGSVLNSQSSLLGRISTLITSHGLAATGFTLLHERLLVRIAGNAGKIIE